MHEPRPPIALLTPPDDGPLAAELPLALTRLGLRCEPAPDGPAVLARAATAPAPALVVLDLTRPAVGGLRTLLALQALGQPPAVVAVVEGGDIRGAGLALQSGAAACLTAPVSAPRLAAVVIGLLGLPAEEPPPPVTAG